MITRPTNPAPGAMPSPQGTGGPSPEVLALVSGFGKALNVASLYGPDHALTLSTIAEVEPLVLKVWSRKPRLDISVVDGALQVDGRPVDARVPMTAALVAKMRDLDLSGFTLTTGMTGDEFRKLITLLAASSSKTPKGFSQDAFERAGLKHVTREKAIYKRVSATEAAAGEAYSPAGAIHVKPVDVEAPRMVVGQILAFLKGDAIASSSEVPDAVRNMASSPEKLAQMIMEATAISQSPSSVASGESLADLVVGCLRRVVDTVVTDAGQQTPDERINIKKSLLVLEKCVLDKLHRQSQNTKPETDRAIAKMFRRAQDEIEFTTASAEYARRRESLEKVERWMVSYVQARPEQASPGGPLEQRLRAAGIPENDIQQIISQGSTGGSSANVNPGGANTAASPVPAELGVLAVLLAQLDELMKKDADPRRVVSVAEEAQRQSESLAPKTAAKIDELGTGFIPSGDVPKGRPANELLAEIAQELAQPVSVINCAVDMLSRGGLGPVSPAQVEMLTVAHECGLRVAKLLRQFRQVIGLPHTLRPMSKGEIAAKVRG